MCGIVGKISFNHASIERTLLEEMTECLAHRGPDGGNVWLSNDGKVGLGHRRLSIIDLSNAASQPMTNEDDSIIICFNGEIYNHLKLRSELLEKGHQFKTDHSDTEVIIHGYEEWGYDIVEHLDGMFAFALWDSRNERLLLARDRIGIKPLYYTNQQGLFFFASEIKAILQDSRIKRTVCNEALYHYLTFVAVPAPLTMFRDIHKLPAGHFMIVDRKGHIDIKKYYEPISPIAEADLSFDEAKSELVRLLRSSIKKRMMSDVPFGVFLSGGVDSSTNVALMCELMERPVETFSVAVQGASQQPHNELEYARQIAKVFNTNHHEMTIDHNDFLDLFTNLGYYQDEPIADPVCVPLYYVARLARKNGVAVIQAGEGADELFCGYDIWIRILRTYQSALKYFRILPQRMRRFTYEMSKYFLVDDKVDIIRRALENQEIFWSGAVFMTEVTKQKILRAPIFASMNSYDIVERNLTDLYAVRNPETLVKMAYIELKHRLPDVLLMRVDKMSMANSVEVRVPFLDHKLVEFALSLPDVYKVERKTGKLILKKAVERLLPQGLIQRKKKGFCGGVGNLLTDEIFAYAKDLILYSTKGFDEIFKMDELKILFKSNSRTRRAYIWSLMNLALWWNTWID